MPETRPRVFLCHNSQDKPIVRRLGELLRTNGIESWIDEVSLGAGCRWTQELADALLAAPAVIVCLGPAGLGRYQGHEIDIITQGRIVSGLRVITVILPSCTQTPDVPIWLSNSQQIDLRRDEIEIDPFGRLLQGIDGRDPAGHYRPTVVVLRNRDEASICGAGNGLVRACHNVLHRIREFDYSELLLPQRLSAAFELADVFVSLLSPDSYQDRSEPFQGGVAAGARRMATSAGLEIVQWRALDMPLPEDSLLAVPFRTTETQTWLPAELARHVASRAEQRHVQRRLKVGLLGSETSDDNSEPDKRSLVGYPLNDTGRRFVRQVTGHMRQRQIDCDSPPRWEFVLGQLQTEPETYDAIVVVLTGDDDWLCECTAALKRLQQTQGDRLPPVRAYLHKADDQLDADPIPIHLKQFEEYFGINDLPRLEDRILAAGGRR